MKPIVLLLLAVFAGYGAYAQHTCCNSDAVSDFAALGSREDFQAAHKTPLPYTYTNKTGEDIHFKTPDGTDGHGYLFKASPASDQYLLVFHEWYGLNDYVKKESEKIFEELGKKVNVLAVDLYDGKIARDSKEAAAYTKLPAARGKSIIQGALDFAGPAAQVATLGWCFGGSWALQGCLMTTKNNAGCVMYYGLPENDVNALKTLQGPVLAIFGNKDNHITPAVADEFVKNMKAAGKKLTVKRYDAVHGFANPSNPDYDSEATRDAFQHTLQFLRKQFRL